jgi:hypothetical protein
MLLQGHWTDNAALCTTMAAPKSVFWHDNHGEEICTVPKCSSWFYQQSEFVFTSHILKWLWTYSLKCCINYAYFRGIQFQNTHTRTRMHAHTRTICNSSVWKVNGQGFIPSNNYICFKPTSLLYSKFFMSGDSAWRNGRSYCQVRPTHNIWWQCLGKSLYKKKPGVKQT